MAFRDEFCPGWRAHLPAIPPRESPGGAMVRESEITPVEDREANGMDLPQTQMTMEDIARSEAMRIYLSDDWCPDNIEWLGAEEAPPAVDVDPEIWPEVRRILRNISGYTHREKQKEVVADARFDGTPGPPGIYDHVGLTIEGLRGILLPAFRGNMIRSSTVRRVKTVTFASIVVRQFVLDEDELEWRTISWNMEYIEWNERFVRDISQREVQLMGSENENASPDRLLLEDTMNCGDDREANSTAELRSVEASPKSSETESQEFRGNNDCGITPPDNGQMSLTETAEDYIEDRIIVVSPRRTAKLLDLDAATNDVAVGEASNSWKTKSNSRVSERCFSAASGVDKKCQERRMGRNASDYVYDRPKTGSPGLRNRMSTQNRQISHAMEKRARESATRINDSQKTASTRSEKSEPSVCPLTEEPAIAGAKKNSFSTKENTEYDLPDTTSVVSDDSLEAMINDILSDNFSTAKSSTGYTPSTESTRTAQNVSSYLPTRHSGHANLLTARDQQCTEELCQEILQMESDILLKPQSASVMAERPSRTERMGITGYEDNGVVRNPSRSPSAANRSMEIQCPFDAQDGGSPSSSPNHEVTQASSGIPELLYHSLGTAQSQPSAACKSRVNGPSSRPGTRRGRGERRNPQGSESEPLAAKNLLARQRSPWHTSQEPDHQTCRDVIGSPSCGSDGVSSGIITSHLDEENHQSQSRTNVFQILRRKFGRFRRNLRQLNCFNRLED